MANKVIFKSKQYNEESGQWELSVDILINNDSRIGQHVSSLPPEATEDELEADILAQYGAT